MEDLLDADTMLEVVADEAQKERIKVRRALRRCCNFVKL